MSIKTINPVNAFRDYLYDTPDPSEEPNITTPDEDAKYDAIDLWMEVSGKRKRNPVEKLERKLRSRRELPY